jgi:hypothetical protein
MNGLRAVEQSAAGWLEQNQRVVSAWLRLAVARLRSAPPEDAERAIEQASAEMALPPAIHYVREAFRLSPFECELLALCAAVELSTEVADLCASLHGDPRKRAPSFALALASLPGAHWSALSADRPLRRYRLIALRGEMLSEAQLHIDERILAELIGLGGVDPQLRVLLDAAPQYDLPEPYAAAAQQLARALRANPGTRVAVNGASASTRLAVARAGVEASGADMLVVKLARLPSALEERRELLVSLERELILSGATLIADCADADGALLRDLPTSCVLTGSGAAALSIDLVAEDTLGQRALWLQRLAADAPEESVTRELSEQFRLSHDDIAAVAKEWRLRAALGLHEAPGAEHFLRSRARALGRPRFEGLARVVIPRAAPDDLVLPAAQAEQLRSIEQHVRHRERVLSDWGFAAREARGHGVSALFHGPSGTGKTLAAEVLAARLRLDLVHVDLSQIVSKYIGETEKNLARIFDAAERGGVVLLFDEADALFGKRSEVKDSHDRYANIEVGYLLQRMEAFRGLAILTTNLRQSLDGAFLRRLRFVVSFPFPDLAQRAEIWRRVLPAAMPRQDLQIDALARLNVAGGNIRNIALHAAFMAASEGQAVSMRHMLRAARDECQRLDRTITHAEVGGWCEA